MKTERLRDHRRVRIFSRRMLPIIIFGRDGVVLCLPGDEERVRIVSTGGPHSGRGIFCGGFASFIETGNTNVAVVC